MAKNGIYFVFDDGAAIPRSRPSTATAVRRSTSSPSVGTPPPASSAPFSFGPAQPERSLSRPASASVLPGSEDLDKMLHRYSCMARRNGVPANVAAAKLSYLSSAKLEARYRALDRACGTYLPLSPSTGTMFTTWPPAVSHANDEWTGRRHTPREPNAFTPRTPQLAPGKSAAATPGCRPRLVIPEAADERRQREAAEARAHRIKQDVTAWQSKRRSELQAGLASTKALGPTATAGTRGARGGEPSSGSPHRSSRATGSEQLVACAAEQIAFVRSRSPTRGEAFARRALSDELGGGEAAGRGSAAAAVPPVLEAAIQLGRPLSAADRVELRMGWARERARAAASAAEKHARGRTASAKREQLRFVQDTVRWRRLHTLHRDQVGGGYGSWGPLEWKGAGLRPARARAPPPDSSGPTDNLDTAAAARAAAASPSAAALAPRSPEHAPLNGSLATSAATPGAPRGWHGGGEAPHGWEVGAVASDEVPVHIEASLLAGHALALEEISQLRRVCMRERVPSWVREALRRGHALEAADIDALRRGCAPPLPPEERGTANKRVDAAMPTREVRIELLQKGVPIPDDFELTSLSRQFNEWLEGYRIAQNKAESSTWFNLFAEVDEDFDGVVTFDEVRARPRDHPRV